MESHRRSIVKALTWRILALVTTSTVAMAVTGKVHFAITIGLIDGVIKLIIYYAHERAWNRIGFGRPKAPDYQI